MGVGGARAVGCGVWVEGGVDNIAEAAGAGGGSPAAVVVVH